MRSWQIILRTRKSPCEQYSVFLKQIDYGVTNEDILFTGRMLSTWAVDNLFIGRTTMNPSTMQDDFENEVQSDSWLFVNDGVVESYCEQNVR